MAHPVYNMKDIQDIKLTHRLPEDFRDRIALGAMKTIRWGIDILSGFNKDKMDVKSWLSRTLMMEAMGSTNGMVAGMALHMRALRTMKYDHTLIHHLFEEAENERVHLFLMLNERKPGIMFRMSLALYQVLYFNVYMLCYILSKRTSHRFTGYLEEEAVFNFQVMIK